VGRFRREDDRYVRLSALLYAMYRHGLIHTHSGKVFQRTDNLIVGWGITYSPSKHLTIFSGDSAKNLWICPECLYQHVLEAMNIYIMDFDDLSKRQNLESKFQEGFLKMARIDEASDVAKALRSDVAKALDSL